MPWCTYGGQRWSLSSEHSGVVTQAAETTMAVRKGRRRTIMPVSAGRSVGLHCSLFHFSVGSGIKLRLPGLQALLLTEHCVSTNIAIRLW